MARNLIVKDGQNILHVAIEGDLKKELIQEAKLKGLPLNTYIRFILIERNK